MLGFSLAACASFSSRTLSIAASWLSVSTMPSCAILASSAFSFPLNAA